MAGLKWESVKGWVENSINEINVDFTSALNILDLNPVDVMNSSVADDIKTAISGVALTLVSMFFIMQFCNEAMYLRIKSYENVFKLIFKFFLAKALVDNAGGLMGIIYNSFNGIAVSLSESTESIMDSFTVSSIIKKPDEAGFFGWNYLLAYFKADPTLLVIQAACWVISLVLIGRLFEVVIYMTVAPIPLATFAGEGWSDSAKTFLKGFAAVCLQSLIIIVMFNAFNGISEICADGHNKLTMGVTALSLAMGVVKSGQWARTTVGMG